MKQGLNFKRFFVSMLLLVVSAFSWAYDLESGFSIWNSAVKLTGLDAEFSKTIDPDWDGSNYQPMSVYSGAQWNSCLVPEEKKLGHTWFVLSDATLATRYGITSLQDLYNKARALYGGDALDVNEPTNASKFKKNTNSLYRLIAYHTLKGKGDYERLTTICTIETSKTNPTEWYGTMDGGNLLKVEHITVKRDITDLGLGITPSAAVKKKYLFLNHFSDSTGTNPIVRGAKVLRPDEDNIEVNEGENFCIYELDRLVDYTQDTQSSVFNKVIRMDMYTMFPELMTNRIRSDVTNEGMAMSHSKDAACKNYWFPAGYIDGLEVNSDAIFIYQGPHNTYWCYEGDEFNITSKAGNYDLTMEIPPLPEGRYQIRLGFADMSTRGVCQFYFDGEMVGAPFDMRSDNFTERTGWTDIWRIPFVTPTSEEALNVLKKMHSLGWYHGPEDVFSISGEGHEDGDPTVTKNYFMRNARTVRYVLGNQPIEIKSDGTKHTIRIKSVHAPSGTIVQLDYLEFVPESEWGDYDPYGETTYDFVKDGIYYVKNDWRSVSVAPRPYSQGYYSGNLEIPSTVNYDGVDYSVTGVSGLTFKDCEELLSVVIPETMQNIPDYAFWNSGLVSVTLKSSSLVSKDYTLLNHRLKMGTLSVIFGSQVKEIVLGDNITDIGAYAFADFSCLTSVTIPESVTSIGDGAFNGCSSLASITIPNSMTSISSNTFNGCSSLASITIPESVTSIGESAFYGCSGLASVNIPKSVTSIGEGAFYECSNLTSVTLNYDKFVSNPLSPVQMIFGPQVTEYILGDNVKSIGDNVFSNCTNLTSVNIPNTVTSIGSQAFSGCSSLTNISIPGSVISIGDCAFASCSGLETISVDASNGKYDSRNNCNAIIETSSNTLISGCKNTIIPNGVTSIAPFAFENCSGLSSITIPESVTKIGEYAFRGCSGLPVEGGVRYADTYLVEAAYRGQNSYSIKEGTKFIGEDAFKDCPDLSSISIPESVTSVGRGAFAECPSLPVSGNLRYADTYLVEAVDKTQETYVMRNDTKFIGAQAFDLCTSLTSIVIPESVRYINAEAFSRCNALTKVTSLVTSSNRKAVAPVKPEPGIAPDEIANLYPFNPAHPDDPTTANVDETTGVTLDNVYPEDECKAKWLAYYKKVYSNRQATSKTNTKWTSLSRNPYIMRSESQVVLKAIYVAEWLQYQQSKEEYDVYSKYETIPTPQVSETGIFETGISSQATLYVFENVIDAYRVTSPWSEFGQILPIDPLAVEELKSDKDATFDENAPIYDLMGRRLQQKPSSGYYIQGGKTYFVK